MELAVVKLSKVGDGLVINGFKDIDAHAMHGVLLPKTNVAIAVLEDVDTIAVTHTVEALACVAF